MPDDDYLQLSGIQHFAFCRRQWALIHLEGIWHDNERTISGELMHERVHDSEFAEKRSDLIIVRGMPVLSYSMKINGKCDAVEFRRDNGGITLFGRKGLWLPTPIEYKRGKPKTHVADKLQLCAQAICLEEMLICPLIETAYLYYGEPKRRETVPLHAGLREKVRSMCVEMHEYFSRRHTPCVKRKKECDNCSLNDSCIPTMPHDKKVSEYIKNIALEG